MTSRANVAAYLANERRRKRRRDSSGAVSIPTPVYGLMTTTADGSTGQTYTLNAAWTDVKWYRMQLAKPNAVTAISGATGLTYVAQAADEGYRLVAVGTDAGVQKASKAFHVVLPPPLILEPFESLAGWTPTNGAQLALATDKPAYGEKRLQLTSTGQNNAFASKDIGSFDPSLLGTIAYLGDLGMDEARASGGVRISLKRAGTEFFGDGLATLGSTYETPAPYQMGRLWGAYHVSEIAGLAAPGASAMGLIVGPSGNPPNSQETKYDALLGKAGGRPTVILGFDDNELTQYQVAFPIMRERGLRGIFYVPAQLTQNNARMSVAMLKEMYAAGWDCGLDSTHNDDISSSFGTMAAWEASFQQNRDFAIANGMPRGNEHICYTHGQIENNPPSNRVLATTVTSDGTDVLSVSGATAYPTGIALAVGMRVAGHNVPNSPATTVIEVISATQVRVSVNVPPQTVPMIFVDTSPEFYTMKLPRRVAALGVRTGRTTKNQGGYLTRFGFGDRGMFTQANALHNLSRDAFVAMVENVILRGLTVEFYTHGIFASPPSGHMQIDEFIWRMDYLKAKADEGLLDNLTWSEEWARDGNAGVPANLQSPPTPPAPAISFVSASATSAWESVAPTGHQAGDLLLAWAYRDGSNTPPSLPAGWTLISSQGANNNSFLLAWKLSQGSSETMGTFSNSTNLIVHCYRGMASNPIGNLSPIALGTSGTATTSASWTLQNTDNTSWVAYFGGSRSSTSSINEDANRIGHNNTGAASDAGGNDTLGPVSVPTSYRLGTSGGTGWYAIAVEIKA